MKYEIGCAIINYCKENTLQEFEKTFTLSDLSTALDLPVSNFDTLYDFLKGALIRDLDEWIELSLSSTSKGNQEKYFSKSEDAYIKLRFFYDDKYWNDFLVEIIASKIFKSAPLSITILDQVPVWTKNGWGCYSKNFCKDMKYISFETLLEDSNLKYPKEDRFNFVKRLYLELGIDATQYLSVMIVLDALVLNEDRHINNFGVLYGDGCFVLPPLFDNGLGLFEHDRIYDNIYNLDVALRKAKAKPFTTDFFKSIKRNVTKETLQDILNCLDIPTNLLYPNRLADLHLRSIKSKLERLL